MRAYTYIHGNHYYRPQSANGGALCRPNALGRTVHDVHGQTSEPDQHRFAVGAACRSAAARNEGV